MTRVFEFNKTEYTREELLNICMKMVDLLEAKSSALLPSEIDLIADNNFGEFLSRAIIYREVDVNLEELERRKTRSEIAQIFDEMKEVVSYWRKRQREIDGENGNE